MKTRVFSGAQSFAMLAALIEAARDGRLADVAALCFIADDADLNEQAADGSVVQAPPERLPDPVRGVGGVRDAAHGHARLHAAGAAASTAAAPERAGGGARSLNHRGAGRVNGRVAG